MNHGTLRKGMYYQLCHTCQDAMHTCKKQNVLIILAKAEGSSGVSPYSSNDAAVVTILLLSRSN